MQKLRDRIHTFMQRRSGRGLSILGIVAVSLILRADDGCMSEERDVLGNIIVGLEGEWETRGSTENSSSNNINAADYADQLLDLLSDVELDEVVAAFDRGSSVSISGARGQVTRNGGHNAARSVLIRISRGGAPEDLLRMIAPSNAAGTEISLASNLPAGQNPVAVGGAAILSEALTEFVRAANDGDDLAAREILASLSLSAEWISTPPPTLEDPDDFDWISELILQIPVRFNLTTPNF